MSWWVWLVAGLVFGLVVYDMYRSRYMLFGAFEWGKKQGRDLRKQNYKNTKSGKKNDG